LLLLMLGFTPCVCLRGIASPACRFCLPPMVSQTTQEALSCPRWVSSGGPLHQGPLAKGILGGSFYCPPIGGLPVRLWFDSTVQVKPPCYVTRFNVWSGWAAWPRTPKVSQANGSTRCCSRSRWASPIECAWHGIASPACRFCLPPKVSQTTQEARSGPRWVSFVGCAASGPAGLGNPWGIALPATFTDGLAGQRGHSLLLFSRWVSPIGCGRMGSHPQHVASACRPWSRRPQQKRRLAPAHAGSRWLGALHQGPLAMGILGGSHSPHPLSVVAWGRIPSMSLLLAAHGLADHKRGSLLRTRAGFRLFGALHQGPLAMGILGGLHSPHAACGLACHMGVQP
jgi:hypothetical protein